LSGLLPGGAIDVIRDQLTRVTSQRGSTLGLTFIVGLAVSLSSANAARKSIFDILNIVYAERERRSFVKLNAISLSFTAAGIAFVLIAIGAMVALPRSNIWACRIFGNCWCASAGGPLYSPWSRWDWRSSIDTARPERNRNGAGSPGQRVRRIGLARRFDPLLLVRGEIRELQQGLRIARRRDRLHDVDLAVGDRDSGRRRDGASDRARHDDRRPMPMGARRATMADTIGAAQE
jgi:hypothetical protein